mmetsp:Transcript_10097/g.18194  ORF Transcript_10097/g.18194 Transcript_10097/m.18194 type:complete len:312 (+) Transcript_10097:2394-3329(+)
MMDYAYVFRSFQLSNQVQLRSWSPNQPICSQNLGNSLKSGNRSRNISTALRAQVSENEYVQRHSLKGKTAVVTGGNRGIGEAISLALAAHGAFVIILARDHESSENVMRDIKTKYNLESEFVYADFSDTKSTEDAAFEVASRFKVDILVNNAGIALLNSLESLSSSEWDSTMAVNLRAPFLMAKHIVKGMKERSYGKIVNISSVAGIYGLEEHGAYCASKGGLNMLTKVMAVEWARFNIQVNSVCPTVILTDMGQKVWGPEEKSAPMLARIPMGRFGIPHEVGDLVAYLSSDAASLICGQIIAADGGYSAL